MDESTFMSDRVLFLGTSDGVASPTRAHASLLLTLGETVVLLDCGEPCSHTMVQHGVPADLIDGIVLSHLHSDHVGGFPMVIQWLWLAGRVKSLPVYMPGEGIQTMGDFLKMTYLFQELLKFPMELKPVLHQKPFTIGDLKFESCRNRHLEGFRTMYGRKYPNAFESLSFRIQGHDKSVVYSGDLASPSDLEPLLQEKKTHLLVVELAHFEPESLFQSLAQYEIDLIAVTHLGAHIQSSLARTKKIASRHLPKDRVVFANDGLTVEF